MKRKQFLKYSGVAATALLFSPKELFSLAKDESPVRIGFIGTGLRGQDLLGLASSRKDTKIVAICDINDRMLADAQAILKKNNQNDVKVYTGSDYVWQDMLSKEKLDGVIIASPWEWHAPMIKGALNAGLKYVATEVILGITLQDHWDVVRLTEQKEAHVMMLENVCYRRDILAVLNMVRQGLFGELIHLQGGYEHDLREVLFNDGVHPYGHGVEFGKNGFSEAAWRTQHNIDRNGELYPTHGIGPIAQMIDINHGNRFTSLCSFSSKSRGLHNHIVDVGGPDHPNAKIKFKLGDVVNTMLNCANGETVLLTHDTCLPRPYSLGFRVQGSNGLWMDLNNSLYIQGKTAKSHQWEADTAWLEKYDHPLWKRWLQETEDAGHGGMDFFAVHSFIESVKRQKPTAMDVYDAAAWSAITPLSENSITNGNLTVDFPDFTRGQWKERKNVFALNDDY